MQTIYYPTTKTSLFLKALRLNFVFLFICSCSLFSSRPGFVHKSSDAFLKAQSLLLDHQFELAIPYLVQTLKYEDADYNQALLLSARAYDQTAQPERALLALNELLTLNPDSFSEIKARSLILKNEAKVGTDISKSFQKNQLDQLVRNHKSDEILVLENLIWSTEFKCDQFCLNEINFLKEIQLQYLLIAENDSNTEDRVIDRLRTHYEFFIPFLKSDRLDYEYRKQMLHLLNSSLEHLHNILWESPENSPAVNQKLKDLFSLQQKITISTDNK